MRFVGTAAKRGFLRKKKPRSKWSAAFEFDCQLFAMAI